MDCRPWLQARGTAFPCRGRSRRNTTKKGEQPPLPEQDAMRSEHDLAPAGTAAGARADAWFSGSAGTAEADGSGATKTATPGATDTRADSDKAGERDRYLRHAAE